MQIYVHDSKNGIQIFKVKFILIKFNLTNIYKLKIKYKILTLKKTLKKLWFIYSN